MKIINSRDLDQVNGGFSLAMFTNCAIGSTIGVVTYAQSAKNNSNMTGGAISAVAGCASNVLGGIPGFATAALTTAAVGAVFAEKVSTLVEKVDTSYWSDFSFEFSEF